MHRAPPQPSLLCHSSPSTEATGSASLHSSGEQPPQAPIFRPLLHHCQPLTAPIAAPPLQVHLRLRFHQRLPAIFHAPSTTVASPALPFFTIHRSHRLCFPPQLRQATTTHHCRRPSSSSSSPKLHLPCFGPHLHRRLQLTTKHPQLILSHKVTAIAQHHPLRLRLRRPRLQQQQPPQSSSTARSPVPCFLLHFVFSDQLGRRPFQTPAHCRPPLRSRPSSSSPPEPHEPSSSFPPATAIARLPCSDHHAPLWPVASPGPCATSSVFKAPLSPARPQHRPPIIPTTASSSPIRAQPSPLYSACNTAQASIRHGRPPLQATTPKSATNRASLCHRLHLRRHRKLTPVPFQHLRRRLDAPIAYGWKNRWVKSNWKKDENMAGDWNYTSGKWNGDPEDKGIHTAEDYRFYAISVEFPEFSNKDKTLVLQFSVEHDQKLTVEVDM